VPSLVLGWRNLRTADALVLVGLTAMAFAAIRFLLLVGPIGSAIAAVALAPALSASHLGRTAAAPIARLSERRRGRRGWVHLGLVVMVMFAGVAATVARVTPAQQERAIATSLPADAAAWLDEQQLDGRMFNRY